MMPNDCELRIANCEFDARRHPAELRVSSLTPNPQPLTPVTTAGPRFNAVSR